MILTPCYGKRWSGCVPSLLQRILGICHGSGFLSRVVFPKRLLGRDKPLFAVPLIAMLVPPGI